MTKLAVIGLGYVGLPLVAGAIRAGVETVGYDVSPHVINGLNSGHSHVDDLADSEISELVASGFQAYGDEAVLATADTIVICVPTPLSSEGGPDLGPVRQAGETIARQLRPGTLVVLESTTWPGTTEEVLRPILESSGLVAGVDFALAFSPERIDPGNSQFGLTNTPKVVGGLTEGCTKRAADFYGTFIDEVVITTGCKEAEMAKLLENTYRHINIALVNEMLKFSNELGVDIWEVIRCASTKPFGFQPFFPGPGVGGHCIPIDPNYLSHRVRAQLGYPFRFVELAQEINHSMPEYVISRATRMLNDRSMSLRGSKVLVLGVTYKPGIADQRESPALPIGRHLLEAGAVLSYWDPYVPEWTVGTQKLLRAESAELSIKEADLVILLQPSDEYPADAMAAATAILDTRGVADGANVTRL